MIVKVECEVRLQPSASLVCGQPHGWAGDRVSRDAIGQVWTAGGTCEPLLVSVKLSSHSNHLRISQVRRQLSDLV